MGKKFNTIKQKQLNPTLVEMKAKQTLRSLYNDHQAFVNNFSFPYPKIKFFSILKSKSNVKAFVSLPKEDGGEYTLHADITSLQMKRHGIRPLYYHEYTHILDHFTLLPHIPIQLKNKMMFYYAEFHGTVIEMQIAAKFTSTSDVRELTLDTMIVGDFEDVKIYDYISMCNQNCAKHIEKYDRSIEDLYDIKRFFCYYIGRMYFMQKYLKEDCSDLFDISIFVNFFGKEIVRIIELLMINDSSLTYLLEIMTLDNAINNKFINAP